MPENTQPSQKVTKAQLVETVAASVGLTKTNADRAISALYDAIAQNLAEGKTVALTGIGTLSVVDTPERVGVRPGTSEKITIPVGKRVKFRVSQELKDSLFED